MKNNKQKNKWYWWAYPPIYKNNKGWRIFRVIGWFISITGLIFLGLGLIFFILYFGLLQRAMIYIQTGHWYTSKRY